MRRPSLRLRPARSSATTAPYPCAVALLLVLPLAGQLPSASPLASGVAAVRSDAVATSAPAPSVLPERDRSDVPQVYRLTPERRALLSTIRFAEGTWLGGSRDGYRVLYGGGRFEGFARHPEVEVQRRYVSAAAGAYQFLPGTWKAVARELGLPDFRPASQDQAALHLVQKRGALGEFDRSGLSASVLARLAPEWASLPSLGGGSVYGQPVHSAAELQGFFQRELQRQRELRSA